MLTNARTAFTAEGIEPSALPAFRSALREAGVKCRGQQVRGGVFRAEIRSGDKNLLQAVAAQHGIAVTVLRERGLRHRLRPYRLRVGLLCGLLLGAAFLWRSNAYVQRIIIVGNSSISDTEILAALEQLGVSRGVPVRDIPFTYIEQRMRLAVSDIERITLRHTGGRITVELREERDHTPVVRPHMASNLVAAYPAQITAVNVLGGHAVCKVGDAVKAGDLLISGIDTDKYGVTHYFRGDGIVTGVYEAEFEAEQPFCTEIPVHGHTETETVLSLFGRRFSLSPAFSEPDGMMIYCEDSTPLMLFGRELPLALIRCHYTEQASAITIFSEEEARGLLEESARRFEQNFHAEDTILSRDVSFQQTDLGISLKIHYVFEGSIGEISEIFVKLS